jgi:ribosomal protein S20
MNTKTAKKEFRKNQRNNYRNTIIRNNARKIKKKLLDNKGNIKLSEEQKQKELSKYMSIMHKMAKKRQIIHAKTANRLISRMTKKINKA